MTNSTKEGVMKIIDPKLTSIHMEEAMHIFYVALLCIRKHNVRRPTMHAVVTIAHILEAKPIIFIFL